MVFFIGVRPRSEPVVRPPDNSVQSTADAHSADGFVSQTKQLLRRHGADAGGGVSRRHGGGSAVGVLPYCPIHLLIHRVRMAPVERTPLFERFCRKAEFFVFESLERSVLFIFCFRTAVLKLPEKQSYSIDLRNIFTRYSNSIMKGAGFPFKIRKLRNADICGMIYWKRSIEPGELRVP